MSVSITLTVNSAPVLVEFDDDTLTTLAAAARSVVGGLATSDDDARTRERRLAYSPEEAAAALGCSRDHFDRHIAPELRIVRRGRRKLIALRELERWLDREAALPVGRERRCP